MLQTGILAHLGKNFRLYQIKGSKPLNLAELEDLFKECRYLVDSLLSIADQLQKSALLSLEVQSQELR